MGDELTPGELYASEQSEPDVEEDMTDFG